MIARGTKPGSMGHGSVTLFTTERDVVDDLRPIVIYWTILAVFWLGSSPRDHKDHLARVPGAEKSSFYGSLVRAMGTLKS